MLNWKKRTEDMRDNIDDFGASGAIGEFGRSVKGGAGTLRRFVGVFPATKGAPGWYAAFVEFGTAARQTGRKYTTRGGRQRKAQGRAGVVVRGPPRGRHLVVAVDRLLRDQCQQRGPRAVLGVVHPVPPERERGSVVARSLRTCQA